MYASPRYTRNHYGGGSSSYASPTHGSYSPTKYNYTPASSASAYDHQQQQQQQAYSPPLKGHASYHQRSYAEYYNTSNNQYYQNEMTHYYHSGSSSTASSSSQEGYDMDDFDEYMDPEMSTVPTVPTPIGLSMYEHGKTPSGRVLVTSGNQTVEFFSGVVNAPLGLTRSMYD